MTSEEKIKEIVREQPYATQNDNYSTMIEYGAIKMSEWKDDGLRKLRDFHIDKFNRYYDQKLNRHEQDKSLGAVIVIDEFLGEDSRDKLHCGFATMD